MSKRTSSDEASPQKAKHVKASLQVEASVAENQTSYQDRLAEAVLHCTVHITQAQKLNKDQTEHICRNVCALLNSAGGVLVLQNVDHSKATPKNLDTFLQGLENKLTFMIGPSNYGDVFDRSGKFDDEKILLFVKAPGHLCSVNSHLCMATDSSVKQATHVQTQDILKSYKEDGGHEPTTDLDNLPPFEANKFRENEYVSFHEGKRIQLKCYSSDTCKQPLDQMKHRHKISECISAFANGDGGEIFIGIGDDSKVIGQSISNKEEFEKKMCTLVDKMHWGFSPVKGIHWDVKFFPVEGSPSHVVIVVSVAGMKNCGGVFHRPPESYYLQPGTTASRNEELPSLGIKEWKRRILPAMDWQKEFQGLLQKLKSLDLSGTPLLMLKDAVKDIREAFFPANESFPVAPEGFELTVPRMARAVIKQIQEVYSSSRRRGLLVGCHSLPSNLNADIPPVDGVVCDLLLVSREVGMHLFTLCSSAIEDRSQLTKYNHAAAQALKRSLVMEGGCKEKFYVSSQVVPCSQDGNVDLTSDNTVGQYPLEYEMAFTRDKFSNILEALVIVLASTPSTLSTKMGVSFLNLLTKDQFQLVKQKINEHREFWVQGAAGTGKSLVAVELMRELRRRDKHLEKNEILYVCENKGMRAQTKRADVCHSVCRKTFMDHCEDFPEVKHVILDEVQNFRRENGDWLSKAREIVHQHSSVSNRNLDEDTNSDETKGFLWFFIDNNQINHIFATGIPPIDEQHPSFTLKKVIRNSKNIFDYANKFLPVNKRTDLEIGHDFEGEKEVHVTYSRGKQLEKLNGVLQSLSEEGYSFGEIAILYHEKEENIPLLNQLNLAEIVDAENNDSQSVVVSTFRKYSGLDRPVVILVDMASLYGQKCKQAASMYCAVTRAVVKLVVLEERTATIEKYLQPVNKSNAS